MVWFLVDDSLAFHQKTIQAGNAAMGLWVRAGSWCALNLTDGYVPTAIAKSLGGPSQIKALITAGLWTKVDGGYRFHQWEQRQETKADIEARRIADRDRKAQARRKRNGSGQGPLGRPAGQPPEVQPESDRNPNRLRPESDGSPPGVQPAPARVPSQAKPSQANGKNSGTGDHSANGPDAGERDDPPPTGPPIRPDAWKLIRAAIPAEHPQATRSALALEAGAMLVAGTPACDVEAALGLWLAKPHLGPKTLPGLVSEVIRNRDRPIAGNGSRPMTRREQTFVEAELLKNRPDPNVLAHFGTNAKALENGS